MKLLRAYTLTAVAVLLLCGALGGARYGAPVAAAVLAVVSGCAFWAAVDALHQHEQRRRAAKALQIDNDGRRR